MGRGRKGKKEEKERGKAHKKKRTERESKEDDRDVTVVFSFPELYHSKVFHIPPPKHIGHHSRIHTVGQPSVGGLTDEPRGQFPAPVVAPQRRGSTSGGGGVMGFAATELPRQNSSGSGGVGTMGGERGAEDGNSGSGRSSKGMWVCPSFFKRSVCVCECVGVWLRCIFYSKTSRFMLCWVLRFMQFLYFIHRSV